MHASHILHSSLAHVFKPMHARRRRVLLWAVEALIAGRRLTLTDLARAWPGAVFMHAPLKAVDRLLSNTKVQQAIPELHRDMARWLLRGTQPVILVDWSDLKHDGRWCLLRAATPMGSRAVTVYERIYPAAQLNSPRAQAAFLDELAKVLPPEARPIMVTDAGFRSDWLRAVAAHEWDYIARIRNNTKVRVTGGAWHPCRDGFVDATPRAEDLGMQEIVQGKPWACRLLRQRKPRRHRNKTTRRGTPGQSTTDRKGRKSAREPWLLATSLGRAFTPARIMKMYAQRMQIEQAFRDLKSHRFGLGFEDSLTRSAARLSVLLLLNALASFAAWALAKTLAAHPQATDPLTAQRSHRGRYSPIRRAMEWLRRTRWPPELLRQTLAEIQ